MTDEELKIAVREAMNEILAEHRPMPVPAPSYPVTEIIIRCGDPEGVKVLGVPSHDYPVACCPASPLPLDPKSQELLQKIKDKTGESPEELIRKLEEQLKAQQLASMIEQYAKKQGIK
ncbi:hypothetical protein HYR99_16045 [Candidatus Poribacteria bacterium]|nr:hypothetical protein [Candidatus Poribacteria bacterium]